MMRAGLKRGLRGVMRPAGFAAVITMTVMLVMPVGRGAMAAQTSGAAVMPEGPAPALAWMFNTGSTTDVVRGVRGTFTGGARLTTNGIYLPGNGSAYFQTEPIPLSVGVGKTLEVLVKLDNLEQRGGGAMSIQSGDGNVYDGIVYSENERRLWEPGSDWGQRGPEEFDFSPESVADEAFVHIAITHSADGFITVYRNGRVHLPRYRTANSTTYDADDAKFTFGARHVSWDDNGEKIIWGQLTGTVACARFYTHELSQEQVASAFSTRCHRANPFEVMRPSTFEGLLQDGATVRSWTNASSPAEFGNWAAYRSTQASAPFPAIVSGPLFAQGTSAASLRHECDAEGMSGIQIPVHLQPGDQYSVSFLATAAAGAFSSVFPFGVLSVGSFAQVFRPVGRVSEGRAGWQQFRFHFTAEPETDSSDRSQSTLLRLLATQNQCILVDNIRLVQLFPRDSLALDPGFEEAAVELGVPASRLDGSDTTGIAAPGQVLSHWVVSPASSSETAVLQRTLPQLTSSWALSLHGRTCASSQYDEVYQAVPTTAGATYRVSLSIRNKEVGGGQAGRVAGALLSFGSVQNRKLLTRGGAYTTYTVTATAAAASTRLRIAAAAADCILVDDVTVTLQRAAPASLVANGGFEEPRTFQNGHHVSQGTVPAQGWTASGAPGTIITVTESGAAASGVQSYRMKIDCSQAASISQVVATVPGSHYRVSFAARAVVNATATRGPKVHTGIVEFARLSDTFQVSGETVLEEDRADNGGDTGWAQFSFNAVAEDPKSSLTFRATPDQCFELDTVSVHIIESMNRSIPQAAGYPDFVSTESTLQYSELEEACEALGGDPAVLTNTADLEDATASCPSVCYVGYDRVAGDGWRWHHGDEDETTAFAPWAQGQQPTPQDVTSGVEDGLSGLVPLGDGSNTYFGLCVVYRDFSAWAGLWTVTFDTGPLILDVSPSGSVKACFNTTDARDIRPDAGAGGGDRLIECTQAQISLVRVDGYNDYYRIERTDGMQANEERIELLSESDELRLQRFNVTTGHFVDDAVGRRVKTCPATIQGLTPHATASCPPFVLPGNASTTCTAECSSGFVARDGTAPTFSCNADGDWEGDLECDSTFEPIRDVRIPFATSAETPFEHAVDGDTSTFWQSRQVLFRSSLFFDLNREETVRRVQIYTRLSPDEDIDDNAIPEFVHIDTAADIRYPFDTRVATIPLQPTTGWQSFDVAVRARFLRFQFTTVRNNAYVRVHEAVFETADDGRNVTVVTPDPDPALSDIQYCAKRHSDGRNSSDRGDDRAQTQLRVRDKVTEGLEMLFTFDDEDCPFEERVSSQLAQALGNAQRTTMSKIGSHAAMFDGQSGLVLERPDVYATSYALSAWIRLSRLPTSTHMIAGDWIASTEDADTLQFFNVQVRPQYLREASASVQLFHVDWEADRWYHIVSQRGPSEQSLWVDGRRQGLTALGVQVPGPRDAFWIGTRGSPEKKLGGWAFEGAIDDVRLYNRTLSTQEINAIYEAAFCSPGSYFDQDGGCQGVSECRPGTVETAPPTRTSDRVCEPCPAGSLPGNGTCAECGLGVFVPAGKTGACADYSCPPGTADKDKDPSTPCDVCNSTSEYQPRPAQTSCIPHTVCGAGQEPDAAKPANALRDTTCKACMANTFKPDEGNAECAPASTCTAGTAIATDATATSDRQCRDCVKGDSFTDRANEKQCDEVSSCADGTHQTQAPTVTSDRVCEACPGGTFSNEQTGFKCQECTATCSGGHYLPNPCTQDQAGRQYDAMCDRCPQGTFRAEADDPTTCREVTRCGDDDYEAQIATPSTDAVCEACTACSAGQFIHSPCRSRSDTECRNCTCADGFYLVEPCDPSSTRTPACRSCPAECATCSGPGLCDTCAGSLQKQADGTCDDGCETGKYRSSDTGECEACADACTSCFGADNGDCMSCNDGFLLHGGKCVEDCDAFSYPVNGSCVQCDECRDGFFLKQCTGNAAQDCAPITTCATGSEFLTAAPTPTSDTKCDACKTCEPGTYRVPGTCAGNTDSICLDCDGLTSYTDESNLPRCKAMTQCPAGSEAQGGSRTSDHTCKGCAAGTTDHDFQPRSKCLSCNAGSFTPANSTGPCEQHLCPAGTVDDDRNPATPCISCNELGTGLYQPSAGQTSCLQAQPCPKGTRQLVSGTPTAPATCVACTQGFDYQDEEGQTECKLITACNGGEYETAAPTLTSDRECGDANPCDDKNQYLLRPGTPMSGPVCDYFTVCTRNLEFEAAPPTPTSDRRCERVTFCGEFEREIAEPTTTSDRVCSPLPSCPPGQGLASREDTTCVTCPAGKFSADRSATTCQDCPTNTFNSDAGQISCRATTACGEEQTATAEPTPTSDRVCEYLVEMSLVGRLNVIKTGDISEADEIIAEVTAVLNDQGAQHNVDPATIQIVIGPRLQIRFITPSEANAHQLRVWANSGSLSILQKGKHYTLRLLDSGDPYVPPTTPSTSTTGPDTTSATAICEPGKEPGDGGACIACQPGSYNNELSRSPCQPCPDNTFASEHETATCTRVTPCASNQYERVPPTPTSDRECASGIGTQLYVRPELTLFRAGPRDVPALLPAIREQVVEPNAQKNGYPASSISISVTRDDDRHVTVGFDSLSRGDLNAFSSVFRRGFVDFKLRGHSIRMALLGFNVTLPVVTTTTATTVSPRVTTQPGKSAGSSSSGINDDTLTALIVAVAVVIVLVVAGAIYLFKRSRTQSANVASPYHSSFTNPVYERSPPAGNTEFFDPGDVSDDPGDYTEVASLEGQDVSYMTVEP